MSDINNYYVGQTAEYIKELGENEVKLYAQITGDYNYMHMDEEKAKKSFFKGRIVHGLLTGGLISALIANKLPGQGNIYLSQSFEFVRYVRIGENVKAKVIIKEIDKKKKIITLDTFCFNQKDEMVLKGEAKTLLIR